MLAGLLNRRVTLQRQVESREPVLLAVTRTWADEATVWAAIEPISGREWLARGEPQADVTTRIRIRYRPGVTADWRVVMGARTWEIDSVIDPADAHDELVLMCRELLDG